jgi:hypothetical protein
VGLAILSILVDAILEDTDGGAGFGGSLDDSLAAALAGVRDVVCAPTLGPCSLFPNWAPGEEVHEVRGCRWCGHCVRIMCVFRAWGGGVGVGWGVCAQCAC